MSRAIRIGTLLGALWSASYASAQQTTGIFDTVQTFEVRGDVMTIGGVEKDTGAPVLLSFVGGGSCVALVLTALESPGRYFLYVAYEGPDKRQLFCRLVLK
jgi:hypothetical protein